MTSQCKANADHSTNYIIVCILTELSMSEDLGLDKGITSVKLER